MRIACVGEAMVELSLDSDGSMAQIGFAGDTLNTAIYLKRALGPDHDVAFVSKVGHDRFSDQMMDLIASEDISTSHIERHRQRVPGLYAIALDADGERSFTYWRDQSAAKTLFQDDKGTVDFSSLDGFDVIYLSAISLAILPHEVRRTLMDCLSRFRKSDGCVAFDSNYRPQLWEDQNSAQRCVEAMWQNTDIGLPSLDDEMSLFGNASHADAIERLRAYAMPVTIVKQGSAGPLAFVDGLSVDHDLTFAPAEIVVDTTAAGDSFNGGFLGAYLSGKSLAEALVIGHQTASHVIGQKGAIVPRSTV